MKSIDSKLNTNFIFNHVKKNYFRYRYGIELVGISTDGDPKMLSSMNYQFSNYTQCGIIVVQDTTHIATKLRNRLLKPGINLPMGSSKVSITHLISLIEKVQKSIHGLCRSDVCVDDKMNYHSVENIMDNRVIEALQTQIENSEATVQYLKLCRNVTSCYLDPDLMPTERIFKMWNGLFFLRIWRKHILSSRTFTLQYNFISSNSYNCIEINARNLITLVKKFREENTPELFVPSLFDSQNCERTFRQLRSLGTIQYTKINFSLNELLHMIGRVEAQNDIAYIKLANEPIIFPNKRDGRNVIHILPTDIEIEATILLAKQEAIKDAQGFGMNDFNGIDDYLIRSNLEVNAEEHEIFEEEDDNNELIENNDDQSENEDDTVLQDTAFTTVVDENGIKRIIRKSALVWSLTDSSATVSKDRTRRFK